MNIQKSILRFLAVFGTLLFLANPVSAQIFGRRGSDCDCDRVIRWQDRYTTDRSKSASECQESENVRDQARNLRDQADEIDRMAREQKRRADQLSSDSRKLRGEVRDIQSEARRLREKVNELDVILRTGDPSFAEKIVAFRSAVFTDSVIVTGDGGISWADAREDWHYKNRTYARDGIDFYMDAAEVMEDLANLKSQEAIDKDRAQERIKRSVDNLDTMVRSLKSQAEDLERIEQLHEKAGTMYCMQASVQFLEDFTGVPDARRDIEKVYRYLEKNYQLLPAATVAEVQIIVENAKASLRQ